MATSSGSSGSSSRRRAAKGKGRSQQQHKGIHGRGTSARQARRGHFESELEDIEVKLQQLVSKRRRNMFICSFGDPDR